MSSYTVCKTFMHICIHIYLHMYTYLCVCSICLYLCSPFLFDFGYWHLGSKSFEGTWMDRQLLSDWAATGFSQCLGGIKWSFMEILIQILQGFHPGNHPGIYCEHGIFPHASWGKHNWKLPPPPTGSLESFEVRNRVTHGGCGGSKQLGTVPWVHQVYWQNCSKRSLGPWKPRWRRRPWKRVRPQWCVSEVAIRWRLAKCSFGGEKGGLTRLSQDLRFPGFR